MTRTITLICLLAGFAVAAENMTLVFADGKKRTVTLLGFNETGLRAQQGGKEQPIHWTELEPESAYRARRALTPYDDGAAILELSQFARKLLLFPQALEQLEVAFALGGLDEAAFEAREREIQAEEVAHLSATIDTLVRAKAPAGATLAAIKRLKERYPEHEANRMYAPLIPGLVEQLATKMQQAQDAQAKKKTDKAVAALHKAVAKEQLRKQKAIEKANALFAESDRAIALRQVSRVKRKLVEPYGAEKYYKRARERLRNIARLDPQGLLATKKDLRKEYDEIEKKLVECYLRVARIQFQERNYKAAVEYVRKVLVYDPIHEEALEMVDEIRANRITFKLSDITNARPRVTGG